MKTPKLPEICYWCGARATTKEHVPPKSFFPEDRRVNLVKVPSCPEHNNRFSDIDERFRVFLQISADTEPAINAFSDKTLRGLKRKGRPGLLKSLIQNSMPARLSGRETLAFVTTKGEFDTFFGKVFKALFFYHTATVFRGDIIGACSHLVHSKQHFTEWIGIFKSMEKHLTSVDGAQPEIFRYKIGPVQEAEGNGFALWLTFYDGISVFGIGTEVKDRQQDAPGNDALSCL